jgi:hypothetical protein
VVVSFIHLLHAGEGNMKIYSPKSIIFHEGNARGEWYSWGNKFSYFLNPHAINVLLYRMKPRKHIHVKYCWQTYFRSIGTLSQTFKNHIHSNIVTIACKWCVPSSYQKTITLAGKPVRLPRGWNMIFISCNMIFVLCNHVFWLLPIVQSN